MTAGGQRVTLCLCELKNLLSDKYPVREIVDGACTLREGNQYRIKLMECGDNIKIVKLPKGQPNVFSEGRKRICDYLIFMPNESERSVLVVFCELTVSQIASDNLLSDDTALDKAEQIKHTIPLLDYILSGLKVHFGKDFTVEHNYVILYKPEVEDNQLTNFGDKKLMSSCEFHGLPISIIRAPSRLSINYLRPYSPPA